jgi:uncharacterized OsmC-like protein
MIPHASKNSVLAKHAGGEAFDIAVRGHTVRTDEPVASGGSDTGPTPIELFSAGLASCVALYVHRACVRKGLDARDLAVEVTPFWDADAGGIGRFDVVLHLPAGIPEDVHPTLEAAAAACPAGRTLASYPEITVRTPSASRTRMLEPAAVPWAG